MNYIFMEASAHTNTLHETQDRNVGQDHLHVCGPEAQAFEQISDNMSEIPAYFVGTLIIECLKQVHNYHISLDSVSPKKVSGCGFYQNCKLFKAADGRWWPRPGASFNAGATRADKKSSNAACPSPLARCSASFAEGWPNLSANLRIGKQKKMKTWRNALDFMFELTNWISSNFQCCTVPPKWASGQKACICVVPFFFEPIWGIKSPQKKKKNAYQNAQLKMFTQRFQQLSM